jgi:uncharacterized membrane protein
MLSRPTKLDIARRNLPILLVVAIVTGFVLAPLPLERKAYAALHGLCAQRPSHSFTLGGSLLPFDARMTGIYLGFAASFLGLLLMRRHRHAGLPTIGGFVVILAMVGAMALDGFNSLFRDLGYPVPYQPDNRLRLFTGLGAGAGLAIMLAMLLGMSLWTKPRVRDRVIDRWWQPLVLYGAAMILALPVLTGASALLIPYSIILLVSATTVVSGLALVTIVLFTGRENLFSRVSDLDSHLAWGVVAGALAMATLAGLRFAIEEALGLPALT